jgi:myo-inositol-1(or 4)-monophosphatase
MKEFIMSLAKEAGDLAMGYLGKAKVSSKGDKNTVTEADKAAERLIISRIKEKMPDANFCAEESVNALTKSDYAWYIDPIDGTANYSHTDPNFAISIAMAFKGELKYGCVYIPYYTEMFYAEAGKGAELNGKKIRTSDVAVLDKSLIQVGVSPLKNTIDDSLKVYRHFMLNAERARDNGFCAGQLAYVACGRADGFVKFSQHPWDFAAGILLVKEAGGVVTDIAGKEVVLDGTAKPYHIIASNRQIHEKLAQSTKVILKEIRPESDKWY